MTGALEDRGIGGRLAADAAVESGALPAPVSVALAATPRAPAERGAPRAGSIRIPPVEMLAVEIALVGPAPVDVAAAAGVPTDAAPLDVPAADVAPPSVAEGASFDLGLALVAHRQRRARVLVGACLAGAAGLTVLAMVTARSPADNPVSRPAGSVVSPVDGTSVTGPGGIGAAGINASVEPPVSTGVATSLPVTTVAPTAAGTGATVPSR
ncbi:MAG: hypothetical protein ACHQNA_07500 [Acidimicrobiales bacterium]